MEDAESLCIPLERLVPSSANMRHANDDAKDDAELQALADSIAQVGMLQPPLVLSKPDGTYEVVAGMRRVRAAQLLKHTDVICSCLPANQDALAVSVIENLHRSAMRKSDTCRVVSRMVEEGSSVRDVAKRLGLGETATRRYNLLGTSLGEDDLDRLDSDGPDRLTLKDAVALAKQTTSSPSAEGAASAAGAGDGSVEEATMGGGLPGADAGLVGGLPMPAGDDEPQAKKPKRKNIKGEPWVYGPDDKPTPIPPAIWTQVLRMCAAVGN